MLFSWFFNLVIKFQTGSLQIEMLQKIKALLLENYQILMFIKDKASHFYLNSLLLSCVHDWKKYSPIDFLGIKVIENTIFIVNTSFPVNKSVTVTHKRKMSLKKMSV